MRACQKLGVRTVAVYSDADKEALHVQMADEAFHIGPPPVAQSYLNMDKIIEVALEAGAQAIHPGYGLLAENAAFARRCQEKGLVFIGPKPEPMEAMGFKVKARQIMQAADVPIVPGNVEGIQDLEKAKELAKGIGYPVMVKASAGGGGIGMQIAHNEKELEQAFKMCEARAKAYFGDPSLYLERYIEEPRHIEIQVLADNGGYTIHLNERECSVQRRHQKVIEEAPSTFVDPDLRQKMGAAAVRAAQAIGYNNAGTVEFLVDPEKNFYFLEMNTRIQVEHPVTEMTTGVDLVEWQLRIASGEPLTLKQEEIGINGHAIECRIYAEDPDKNFMPSPGKITRWQVPELEGFRADMGVYEGYTVSPYYDPLLAKFITWGETRDQAIDRMIQALESTVVDGIRTNISFHIAALKSKLFREGRTTTNFIDQLKKEE
ncbi:MAG TPA: acetyl-CoA carboxylase biotin carboxylase subunit [Thermosulfidibacter takaii]|uniref:Acetyl-CoA carboxylase biotin carboxylase subunit n=1 Tax=Thermosulfidibacter takaii TaxID=412593 RepID=A0A7C0U6X3_9BACT|nr:acetyl-CoA carboxylase biotin carboxylase subunit [Thermosulfidibacter takaii]